MVMRREKTALVDLDRFRWIPKYTWTSYSVHRPISQ